MIALENILIVKDHAPETWLGKQKPSTIKPIMDIAEHQSGIDFAKNFNRARKQLARIIKCN